MDEPVQPRGEVVGPKLAAQQLLNSGELERIPLESHEQPGEEPGESWEALIAQVITIWNSVAKGRMPIWVFSPTEVQALSGAWAPVAQKYAGPGLSVEAAAVLVTASVVLPRAAVSYKRKKNTRSRSDGEEKKNQESQSPQQDEEVHSVEGALHRNGNEGPHNPEDIYQDELPKE